MDWRELIIYGYGSVLQALERALDGLTQEDLDQQPHPDCNSMGWLAWHLTRSQDAMIASLTDTEQLWVSDEWYTRFKRPSNPKDTGFGHSSEDVAAFSSPDADTLLEYHRAVLERTKRYISSLPETDLDQEMPGPFPTLGARLAAIMGDNLQHVGQIAYVRGLLKGKGWSRI